MRFGWGIKCFTINVSINPFSFFFLFFARSALTVILEKNLDWSNFNRPKHLQIDKIFFEIKSPSNRTQPKPKIYLIRNL